MRRSSSWRSSRTKYLCTVSVFFFKPIVMDRIMLWWRKLLTFDGTEQVVRVIVQPWRLMVLIWWVKGWLMRYLGVLFLFSATLSVLICLLMFCFFQVLSVIKNRNGLKKISFVAHSLGGLVARYAVGKLYEKPGEANSSDSPSKAKSGEIAGLEPMNFITFATPHLGSRGHRQVTWNWWCV